MFWSSIREINQNKFDCGIENLEAILCDENKYIMEQKKNLTTNSKINQNIPPNESQNSVSSSQTIDNINDSLDFSSIEDENANNNQYFSIEDFFKNNYFCNNIEIKKQKAITIEKLLYFFSIGEF